MVAATIEECVETLAVALVARGEHLGVAESCTGGLIAARITDRAGSSGWFDCGFVTYSNAAKQAMLGVPAETLAQYGAVSGPTVMAMTAGVLERGGVDWALAVSGVAGPGGGSVDKPVGTVWIAWQGKTAAASCSRFQFPGDRVAVRNQAVLAGLQGLLDVMRA
ncbi:MAG: CinA family protein [Nevskiaceae bacterium]|nr:MAG: CinA family protein [Nevskiaceae bacterium]TBR71791.1 MAG: CinA family protein [Nevskiaceae bacterium]